jgi:hypothetical protein
VAVDDKGDVWAWGVGELGQLGFGEECGLAVQAPRVVPFFQRRKASVIVVDVAAAKKHTLYLTQNGQVPLRRPEFSSTSSQTTHNLHATHARNTAHARKGVREW